LLEVNTKLVRSLLEACKVLTISLKEA
jgi:hypothetical protein